MIHFFKITDWERKFLWRRVPCAIVRVSILLVLLSVLIMILGPPITVFFTARWEAKKVPELTVGPRPLSIYSKRDAPGTVVTYFGYEFEVPWNKDFREKGIVRSGLVQLESRSGQSLTFIAPENQDGLLTELVQDESTHMKNLQVVFGDLLNQSAYDQYAALLNTTPSTIRAFGPRAEATRGMTLLTMKALAFGPGMETGIFSFELPDKRGFQIGDPSKSNRVDLEVFDVEGHHVEIICIVLRDSTRFSQPELNQVLTSLHALAPESFAKPSPRLTALPNRP